MSEGFVMLITKGIKTAHLSFTTLLIKVRRTSYLMMLVSLAITSG